MQLESQLAEFILQQRGADAPASAQRIAKLVLMAAGSCGVAASGEDGIAALRGLLLERGGAAQARTLVFGDWLPANAAAQLNGTLCRALEFCDAMAPGPHIGSSLVPACFAAAELRGGCSGDEFLSALVVGCEVGARFNLNESQYDGFDPTGVAVVFAATAGACRVLGLSTAQTVHALGLAFNRCGGSFQSNIDGSLAVRLVQGWVAQTGIECAQLAQRGLSGPVNFLEGVYGYPHLYGRDRLEPATIVQGLGEDWRLHRMMFKPYPSCGATQGLTELTLQLVRELQLQPEQVRHFEVRQPPYSHKLVGHAFKLGPNPRVDAQFSNPYCVANAIVRGGSTLAHFRSEMINDAAVLSLAQRVSCVGVEAMNARGHTAVDVVLTTTDGLRHERGLDIAPGFPGAELSDAQQLGRFHDCMAYAARPLPAVQVQVQGFLRDVEQISALPDARTLLSALILA